MSGRLDDSELFISQIQSGRLCIRAANQLAEDDALYGKLMLKQQIPCVELARRLRKQSSTANFTNKSNCRKMIK